MSSRTLVTGFLSLAFGFANFSFQNAKAATQLNICMNDWPPNVIGWALHKMGKLPTVKMNFTDYATCTKRFEKGLEDLFMATSLEFIMFKNRKIPFQVVDVQDYSSGGDGVALVKGLKPSDLKGKSIALQADSTSIIALSGFLAKHNLKFSDIKIVDIKAENLAKAITSNKVTGGVVTWSPTLQEMEKNGGEIVYTTKDSPELIFDATFARKEAIENKEKAAAIKDYIQKWHAAVNDDAVLKVAAEKLRVTLPEYKTMLQDMYLYSDVQKSKAALKTFSKVTLDVLKAFDNAAMKSLIATAKEIPKGYDVKSYADCCTTQFLD